ncbi:hypothetical protein CMsap09_00590 [Clavibacter michiganensis]|uniref:Uncharacterized protein n=1 Tax=Clavibacter michiganensis TaxID=28447 RepID=A0A251XPB7_9MICO|nr:hypothetical protein CMsap09_00590 [Clavibacter michiganensis]
MGHAAEQAHRVGERLGRRLAAREREREHGSLPVGQVPQRQLVGRARREPRVVDRRHLRPPLQEARHRERVRRVPLDAQRQGLDALPQEERAERRGRRAEPGRDDLAGVRDEGTAAVAVGPAGAAEGALGLGQVREELRPRGPVEGAAVDDHAAEHRSVSREELARGVHHHVGAVLDRAEQVRGRERVVDHERQAVPVRDVRDAREVEQVVLRVRDGLAEQHARRGRDPAGPLVEVAVVVHEVDPDAEPAEVLAEEAAVALVDAARGEDPVAGLQDREKRGGGRRLPAREEDRLGAALELGEPLLDLVGGGVAVARVQVALVGPGEAVAGFREAVEDEAGGEVHGRDAGAVVGVDGGAGVDLPRGEAGGDGRDRRDGHDGRIGSIGPADPLDDAHAPNTRREAMAAPSTSAPSFAHATSVATNS